LNELDEYPTFKKYYENLENKKYDQPKTCISGLKDAFNFA
jgi:hypothetical protein